MDQCALRIRLLGEFRVDCDGVQTLGLNTPRLQALLAYLALHRTAPQPRQHLAFLFWPDSTEAQARTNLRKLLLLLRQALPHADDFLVLEGPSLQWRDGARISIDVSEFERASTQCKDGDPVNRIAALKRAADLYRGELLPGHYEEWLLAERARLAEAYGAVLSELVGASGAERDYATAIHYGEALLQHDPLVEPAYRDLMRVLALSGNRASALRVYHSCVTYLRKELDVEPAPETRLLYDQLLRGTPVIRQSEGEREALPLVGRQAEWSRLRAAWRAAMEERAQLVVLAGEAGIGKTRLMDELYDLVVRQGGAVARARCATIGGMLAYAPVAAWLRSDPIRKSIELLKDPTLTELSRLLPELADARPGLRLPAPITDNWQRRVFYEALATAVIQPRAPLLLLIDDLQWCDAETLEWLTYLLSQQPRAPLCVVTTLRSEEAGNDGPLLDLRSAAGRDGQLTEIELQPLTPAEGLELASSLSVRHLPPQHLERIYNLTEGNPLFIIESVRSVLEATGAAPEQALFAMPPLISSTVEAVVTRRLSLLSPGARDLSGLAAVFGREFSSAELIFASELGEDALLASLDEMWRRRIVRERSRGAGLEDYEFTHDRIREAAYLTLGAGRRRTLHRKVAEALETRQQERPGALAGRIAYHYRQAGLLEAAAQGYLQAAETAERLYAHREAIEHWRNALQALGENPVAPLQAEAAGTVAEQLGDTLHLTAQYSEAIATFRSALSYAPAKPSLQQARLIRKIANVERDQRLYESAVARYNEAEMAMPVGRESAEWQQEWIRLQFDRVQLYYWMARVGNALEILAALEPEVEAHGTAQQRWHLLSQLLALTMRRQRFGPSPETEAYLDAIPGAAADLMHTPMRPNILFMLGMFSLLHGRVAEAGDFLSEGLLLTERTGDISLQARCLTYLTIARRRQAAKEEVRNLAARSAEVAAAADMPEYVATAWANQAWVAWGDGDMPVVEAKGQAALKLWAQLPQGHASAITQWTALWPLLGAALRENDVPVAIEYARALLAPPQQLLPGDLAASLLQAIDAFEQNDLANARQHLARSAGSAISVSFF